MAHIARIFGRLIFKKTIKIIAITGRFLRLTAVNAPNSTSIV